MRKNKADVVLIQMPHTWLNPSLALGLLKEDLHSEGISNEIIYASHQYIDFIGTEFYKKAVRCLDPIDRAWEMLFAPFTDFEPMEDALSVIEKICRSKSVFYSQYRERFSSEELWDILKALWPVLLEKTDCFLEHEAELILKRKPKVVGCSVLTEQRNASFAMLKRIKEKQPEVATIIGGGLFAGDAGPAVSSHLPSIDYVFSGEGDGALGKGCALIMKGKREELLLQHPEFLVPGAPAVNRAVKDMNDVPVPDYTEYFAQLKKDGFVPHDGLVLIMESSRGCWWGQKNRCRFCGLHSCPDTLRHRKKSEDRVWKELNILRKKYGVSEFIFSDCIIDMGFVKNLPEDPPDERRGLSILAECKSNLRDEDMRRLRKNGFTRLQPGIESLSDELLNLMNKGASTIDQLACLKYARKYGVGLYWNIIYALPGEKKEWYEGMLEIMKHIHHFQHPTGMLPMMLMRNSVFFEDHEAFGIHTVRTRINERACDPDIDFSFRTAYVFETPDVTVDKDLEERLFDEFESWRRDYRSGRNLIMSETGDCTLIRDTREPGYKKVFRLTGAARKINELALETVSEKKVIEEMHGCYSETEIQDAIDMLTRNWILFRQNGRILSLVLPENRWLPADRRTEG